MKNVCNYVLLFQYFDRWEGVCIAGKDSEDSDPAHGGRCRGRGNTASRERSRAGDVGNGVGAG